MTSVPHERRGAASWFHPFAVAVVALLAVPAACSSNGHGSADAADGGPAGDGAPPLDVGADQVIPNDDGAEPDAALPGLTCQGIRLCVAGGGTTDACSEKASTDARAVFQKLLACVTPHCPALDTACVCRETCQQPDGYCLDETDACVAASGSPVDAVCGQSCGG